jgi:hypothetical protein
MIFDQIPNIAIFCLLSKTSDVYALIMEEETLAKVPSSMLENSTTVTGVCRFYYPLLRDKEFL